MTEPALGSTLAGLLCGMAREIARGHGPVKWCKSCGRKHGSRAPCGLVEVHVPASSGRMVARKTRAPREG